MDFDPEQVTVQSRTIVSVRNIDRLVRGLDHENHEDGLRALP